MLRATWNWIVGLVCVVLVAVIWIAASFVVQSVVDSGISPFLIAYICNSLFMVYIPIVELVWWIKRRYAARKTREAASKNHVLTNAEKAKLLETGAGSDIEIGGSLADARNMQASSAEISEVDSEVVADARNKQASSEGGSEVVSDEEESSSSTARRLLSRRETAKISALICPVWFFAQFTFNLSLKYTTVTSNTVLSSTSTLFTFIASVMFLNETFTVLKIVSVVLCMAGSAVVAFGDSESLQKDSAPHPVVGDMVCLLSAMLYACYTSLIRKKFPDENSSAEEVSTALFLGYLGLFNALIFCPVVVLLHFTGLEPIHRLTATQWELIVGKGMLDNVLSDYLWAEAVLLTSTTVATAGLTLQVPIAAVVDSLRGHAPGTVNVVGAVAVLAGFFGINQPENCCSTQRKAAPGEEARFSSEQHLDDPVAATSKDGVLVDPGST
ncbi:hypothetical protein SELMODRAFT_443725 [Selaginella moellendorffii]|uniref:EamA domain-containing protein n=1 Tax=Selaginella moellendorffii TaxID=88036 RepID=D8S3X0_SELML|nr:uncharacterized transporter C405.03c [Selaginella moellendorffii]XP_024538921.1 uncharacterized transporter C405.03c [Selaginella moellendorffii]EFJ20830.1 hypothetical protein SELMODRAFT_443725 [Selaginella moellendorffii]|eukprot:XP_002978173.1 uncharacterized transporter C405.03c [Selaginella moellendorffii]